MEKNTTEVNENNQLFGYQHSSKYLLLCKRKTFIHVLNFRIFSLRVSNTVSTPDATVAALQQLKSVYTGRDKATVENHLKFVSIRHK